MPRFRWSGLPHRGIPSCHECLSCCAVFADCACGLLCQILKQAELREFRKHEDRSTPSFGRRASRPLEAKWRLNIPRSPLCEGCGVRTVAAAEGSSGSKAWKCGPCVRAIEEVASSLKLPASHSAQVVVARVFWCFGLLHQNVGICSPCVWASRRTFELSKSRNETISCSKKRLSQLVLQIARCVSFSLSSSERSL